MKNDNRRYDIDWLRVIAIGLLLIYHIAIGFQSWGIMLGFIVNEKTWESLWIPMTMLNVWRIPLLFFVSGMGVYFSMQNKNWKQVMAERARRILLPFAFGVFILVPIPIYLWQYYYHWELSYHPNPGYLWFLGNIFIYVVLLLPVFLFLQKNGNGRVVQKIKKWLCTPLGLFPVIAAFIAETLLVNPVSYEFYAMTWHGFFLGLLAFFFGFYLMFLGKNLWNMMRRGRWLFLVVAVSFYTWRLMKMQLYIPTYQLAAESVFWIFSVFAFGYRYLNHPGKVLGYLSQAAYPVYIMHMPFLFLGSLLVFPLDLTVQMKFMLVLLFTTAGCLIFYEFIIRRINFIRPLFGLKRKLPKK